MVVCFIAYYINMYVRMLTNKMCLNLMIKNTIALAAASKRDKVLKLAGFL